jgi:hypothetical protein
MTIKARYREPYNARHSFVSWNLMLGKNLLWVAKQHGHSVQTMLDVYAAWIEGSQEADLDATGGPWGRARSRQFVHSRWCPVSAPGVPSSPQNLAVAWR